jgi:hypothetical protein
MTIRTPDSERLARLERLCAALALQAYGESAVASGLGITARTMRLRAQQDAAAILREQAQPVLETRAVA